MSQTGRGTSWGGRGGHHDVGHGGGSSSSTIPSTPAKPADPSKFRFCLILPKKLAATLLRERECDQEARAHLRSLHSEEYSDLVIKCGVNEYKVHKVIVCSQSEVFAAAMRFQGKEHNTNILDLKEDEPEIIRRLVQYLYNKEYDPIDAVVYLENNLTPQAIAEIESTTPRWTYDFPHTCSTQSNELNSPRYHVCPHHRCVVGLCSRLNYTCLICANFKAFRSTSVRKDVPENILVHAKMYQMGDKYMIPRLKELAAEKFDVSCEKYWHHKMFMEAAHHAISTAPPGDSRLSNKILETICAHPELIKEPSIQVFLHEYNRAYSVLESGHDL